MTTTTVVDQPGAASLGGGVPISISGRGFAPLTTGTTFVTVCGAPCRITASSYSSISCVTPAIATTELLGAVPPYGLQVFTGTPFSLAWQSVADRAFDGNVETSSQSNNNNCNVGIDLGPNAVGSLQRVRYYPAFQQAARMSGGIFSASVTGATGTYVNLATINGRVQVRSQSLRLCTCAVPLSCAVSECVTQPQLLCWLVYLY